MKCSNNFEPRLGNKIGQAAGPMVLVSVLLLVFACTPTIRVEAPSEPIEINLNIKISHEIKIKVDKDLEQLFEDEADLF